ncbi:hypothetical protein GCM10020219_002530 [Nonomuraea dietziae]
MEVPYLPAGGGRVVGEFTQQRRLADASGSADEEKTQTFATAPSQQVLEGGALRAPADELTVRSPLRLRAHTGAGDICGGRCGGSLGPWVGSELVVVVRFGPEDLVVHRP